jgi:hypothetical protein
LADDDSDVNLVTESAEYTKNGYLSLQFVRGKVFVCGKPKKKEGKSWRERKSRKDQREMKLDNSGTSQETSLKDTGHYGRWRR